MSQKNFDEAFINIANGIGISLYARFGIKEAGLFLRISEKELESLTTNIKSKATEFFGYQLVEYLLNQTT